MVGERVMGGIVLMMLKMMDGVHDEEKVLQVQIVLQDQFDQTLDLIVVVSKFSTNRCEVQQVVGTCEVETWQPQMHQVVCVSQVLLHPQQWKIVKCC